MLSIFPGMIHLYYSCGYIFVEPGLIEIIYNNIVRLLLRNMTIILAIQIVHYVVLLIIGLCVQCSMTNKITNYDNKIKFVSSPIDTKKMIEIEI